MVQELVDRYVKHFTDASAAFTNQHLQRKYALSKVHCEHKVLPKVSFTKCILRFVPAPEYYADSIAAHQKVQDHLNELVANGVFSEVVIDTTRIKGQVCYKYNGS